MIDLHSSLRDFCAAPRVGPMLLITKNLYCPRACRRDTVAT